MTPLAVLIFGVVLLLAVRALFSRADRVRETSLTVAVVAIVLIPTFGVRAELVITINALLTLVLLISLARGTSAPGVKVSLPAFAVIFAVYLAISESLGSGIGHIISEWVRLAFFLTLAMAAFADHSAGRSTVFKSLVWLLPIELIITVAEQRFSWANAWPRGDVGFDDIHRRVNELVPQLAGRSLGTMGHPILLGTFAVIAFIGCMILYRNTKQKRYLLLLLCVPPIVALSGTRSAAVALILVAAAMFAFMPGRALLLRIVVALGVGVAVTTVDVLELLGFGGVQQTSSYLHRSGVIGSVPRLLDRDPMSVMFGSGVASGGELFNSGTMQGYPGYYFFDNEYVRILAFAGVIGIVLLAIALVNGFVRVDAGGKLVLLAMCVFMASYDVMTWDFSYAMVLVATTAKWGGSIAVVTIAPDHLVEERGDAAR